MADRTLKLRELRKTLRRYGVQETSRRGKGSHILFYKVFREGTFSYPVPDEPDVLVCYVKGCRKKFRLTAEDGISDKKFYGR